MSMTSNCATVNVTPGDYQLNKAGRSYVKMSVLGTCFRDNGDRMDSIFNVDAHEASFKGVTNPVIDFEKLVDWLARGRHEGHAITALGAVVNDKGTAQVYYCQKDHRVCFDTKS